jgi:GrpB-like predicted nucleotidyltransferase (UPF0157 family)
MTTNAGSPDRIEVVAYDPGWHAAFEAEAVRLSAALQGLALRVDHVGSTAVPGLGAKPIIDIQVSVASVQSLPEYVARLASLGYVHVPHADDSFCPFFHRPDRWPHSHHVHLVERGGVEERRTLAFRDYLRDHSSSAKEYERLKRTLAARIFATDQRSQEDYALAKSDFIEGVIARALSEGYPRDEGEGHAVSH